MPRGAVPGDRRGGRAHGLLGCVVSSVFRQAVRAGRAPALIGGAGGARARRSAGSGTGAGIDPRGRRGSWRGRVPSASVAPPPALASPAPSGPRPGRAGQPFWAELCYGSGAAGGSERGLAGECGSHPPPPGGSPCLPARPRRPPLRDSARFPLLALRPRSGPGSASSQAGTPLAAAAGGGADTGGVPSAPLRAHPRPSAAGSPLPKAAARGSLRGRAAGPGEGGWGRGASFIVSCFAGKFPAPHTARAPPRPLRLSPGVSPCPVTKRGRRGRGGGGRTGRIAAFRRGEVPGRGRARGGRSGRGDSAALGFAGELEAKAGEPRWAGPVPRGPAGLWPLFPAAPAGGGGRRGSVTRVLGSPARAGLGAPSGAARCPSAHTRRRAGAGGGFFPPIKLFLYVRCVFCPVGLRSWRGVT